MPSIARINLDTRLHDIDQLIAAHKAITQFQNAKAAANQAGGGLAQAASVFTALVTNPGPGKPKEVEAINRAAFVLLCSHMQGFVDELHSEAANCVLRGKVNSISRVIQLIKPRNSNPHVDIIDTMFSGLGIYDLMSKVKWQKCSNATVKTRLGGYITQRNKIAHGAAVKVSKDKVVEFRKYVTLLADKLDTTVGKAIKAQTGVAPW